MERKKEKRELKKQRKLAKEAGLILSDEENEGDEGFAYFFDDLDKCNIGRLIILGLIASVVVVRSAIGA